MLCLCLKYLGWSYVLPRRPFPPSVLVLRDDGGMDIKQRFDTMLARHPARSTFINYSEAVSGSKATIAQITKLFEMLVESKDYNPSLKPALIIHLYNRSWNQ